MRFVLELELEDQMPDEMKKQATVALLETAERVLRKKKEKKKYDVAKPGDDLCDGRRAL